MTRAGLPWPADARIVLVAKAARTCCYGFLGILLPIYLSELGVGARGVGVMVTLTLASSAALTWGVRRPAERWGARVALIGLAALSLGAAAMLLLSRAPWLVIAAAMLGNVAVGAGETGPFLTLEQVVVTRAVAGGRPPFALSLYNLLGYAAGAPRAGAAGLLPPSAPFPGLPPRAPLPIPPHAGPPGPRPP